MTTDAFTTAARAEAERRHPDLSYAPGAPYDIRRAAFREGAAWAQGHLAAQDPTDAEVDAAARPSRSSHDATSFRFAG